MRVSIRTPSILALALAGQVLSQSQADLAAAALLQGKSGGNGLASTNLQRKVDFPNFPIVDSTFRLSCGDQLRLRWWGLGSNDQDLVVDTRGDLVIPDMGRVKATNSYFRAVRDSVEAMIRRRTKVSLFDLQIVRVVNAQVRISGFVPTPGLFDLSPGTRLSVALSQAGLDLPSLLQRMQGGDPVWNTSQERLPSLRRVLLIRGDQDSVWCDLVAALRAGDVRSDPPLFFGDRVQLFARGPLSQITGGANFPGGMEVVPGETLHQFLHASGEDTLLPIQVDGQTNANPKMDSVSMLIRFPAKVIRDRPPIAWVVGKVYNPGAFPLHSGTTAKDLVQMAGGVMGGDDSGVVVAVKRGWAWLGAGRQRGLADATQYPEVRVAMLAYFEQMRGTYTDISTPLQAGDTVFVHPAEQVVWVGGQVNKPGFVPWKRNAKVEDYVLTAGGWSERAWKSRTRIFDLQSGLSLQSGSEVRPGAAIIVPESRYISFDQWVGIVVSVASLALTAATFYATVFRR
jgi:protein involved in polysaccharide export with SLBB domain